MKRKPKHVGSWVVACCDNCDMIHWGLKGGTTHPYPPDDKEAVEQLKYLAGSTELRDRRRLYLLHVFDNGQIKTLEYDQS